MIRAGTLLALGLLTAGEARAQLWPLQTGPGGDIVSQAMADFDRLRRGAPELQPDIGFLPGRAAVAAPAWTPPPMPRPRPVRRTAAPRREPAVAAAPMSAPVATPSERRPDLEAVERRLAERERTLRDLQRDLVEERKLVEEWRGGQRTSR
ncbi:hypothetical protein E2C06_14385 [Dankookia rubra]|uniref:Uncharacterized protein n=1 Tax=Dankookia rubra TaxID=1442381 RepID=A0A4R5QGQ5_9PROT|nr:hypothetical protein [Dankookia rubra]TDH61929.1 hypothetical protein E2C06_14385 [Dankookia rubra]